MSYRSENVGIELHRQRFEEAKATLEELAERTYFPYFNERGDGYFELHKALHQLGFRQERLADPRNEGDRLSDTIVYVRKNKKGLELLADGNLARKSLSRKKEIHLYQAPTKRDLRKWHQSLSPNPLNFGVLGAWGGVGLSIPATMVANKYFSVNFIIALIGGMIFGPVLGYVIGKQLNEPGEPLAKGPDALRYIKNNSTCEAPKLRKVRVIDAEFTDEKAEQEHKETLEALAIDQQAREQQQVRRK